MSTTSTVITIAICVILVFTFGLALVKGLWSTAKKITIPIQIALFVVLLVCVVRLFATKENAQRLYKGIEQTGIGQNVENTVRTALTLKPAVVAEDETKAQPRLTISLADNAYCVTVECSGSLDAAEKKEVGKLIIAALGRRVGKTIERVDKSKISIEARYDEATDVTSVVAVVPTDAID